MIRPWCVLVSILLVFGTAAAVTQLGVVAKRQAVATDSLWTTSRPPSGCDEAQVQAGAAAATRTTSPLLGFFDKILPLNKDGLNGKECLL